MIVPGGIFPETDRVGFRKERIRIHRKTGKN